MYFLIFQHKFYSCLEIRLSGSSKILHIYIRYKKCKILNKTKLLYKMVSSVTRAKVLSKNSNKAYESTLSAPCTGRIMMP